METFKGKNLLEFAEHFKTDLDCERHLSHWTWKQGYACHKYGNVKYQVRKDFSRTCNVCSDTKSPSSGTLLHIVNHG